MNGASCISHKCTVSTTFSFAMSFLLSSPSATATRIGLHVSWWSVHGRDCSLLLRLSVMTRLTSIRLKHFSHYNRVNPSIENGPLLSPFLPWFSKSLLSHWLGMGQSVLGSLLSNMVFLWNSTCLWLCTIDALFTTFFSASTLQHSKGLLDELGSCCRSVVSRAIEMGRLLCSAVCTIKWAYIAFEQSINNSVFPSPFQTLNSAIKRPFYFEKKLWCMI